MTVTLVTYARFVKLTKSAASAAEVDGALAEAIDRLESALDRKLESDERTERMHPDGSGRLRPHAIPVTVATGYTIDGYTLIGGAGAYPTAQFDLITGWQGRLGTDVTYTGGWVERSANPDATNRLPIEIEEDLCWAAHALLCGGAGGSQVPAGALSVTQGDSSVTFGPQGASGVNRSGIRWSRNVLEWRYRSC